MPHLGYLSVLSGAGSFVIPPCPATPGSILFERDQRRFVQLIERAKQQHQLAAKEFQRLEGNQRDTRTRNWHVRHRSIEGNFAANADSPQWIL